MPPLRISFASLFRRFGSVKFCLSLTGVLLIALSVATTVGLVLKEVAARTEEVALDLSLSQTRKLAKMIGSRVVGMQLNLRAAASTVPAARMGDAAEMREWLAAQAVMASILDTLMVAAADGRVVAWRDGSGTRTPELNIRDRDYFRLTMAQGRPVISEPMRGRMSNEPIMVVTMPVHDAAGKPVGMIGGSIRLLSNGLMPDVTAADADDVGTLVITDQHGRVLSHGDRRWLTRDAGEDPLMADGMAYWVRAGRPVEPAGFSLRAGRRIVSMAGVPDAEWMVMHSASADEVLGGLQAGRRRALAIGSAVALAGGLVLLLVTHRLLQPLRRLQQRTLRMRDGDLADEQGWPRAIGEIGQLSNVLRETLHERSTAAAANRELLSKLTALMAHAPLGIAFTQARHLDVVNGAFERLLGYGPDELRGRSTTMLYPSVADAEAMGERIGASFRAGRPFDEEVQMVRRDGSQFWGRLFGAPVRWGDNGSSNVWTLEDVSHARSQREALSWASTHDTLTELVNRREFERLLAERLARPGAEPSCALFIDLDYFKAVNDTAGHATGDRVLMDVAQRLQEQVRTTDTVARLGGDEFGVLLSACSRADALRIAENMRAAIEAYRLRWQDRWLQVGVSIGIVKLTGELPDMKTVMAAADAACYDAKRRGRNRVAVHGADTVI